MSIRDLKSALDLMIQKKAKKKEEKRTPIVQPVAKNKKKTASLSSELKKQLVSLRNRLNASDDETTRKRLRGEISIIRAAYRRASRNEVSGSSMPAPKQATYKKYNHSACDNAKQALRKLTDPAFRHQVFFCSDKKYRAQNPLSCGKARRFRRYSVTEYRAKVNDARLRASKICNR